MKRTPAAQAVTTGWPPPPLAQDDCRPLFRWFASKPDARLRVREALPPQCTREGCTRTVDCSHTSCPLRRTLTAGPGTPHGFPRLADEHLPPDER